MLFVGIQSNSKTSSPSGGSFGKLVTYEQCVSQSVEEAICHQKSLDNNNIVYDSYGHRWSHGTPLHQSLAFKLQTFILLLFFLSICIDLF
jgi:hypothetical protein